ncbi:Nuclear pore complex protein Nup88 [Halotydeus destructor]|nr:Nuclear pore complex protein Nup88 [Halotydeus destructor]
MVVTVTPSTPRSSEGRQATLKKALASGYEDQSKPRNLLALHDDQLFTWNPEELSIWCHKLKRDKSIGEIQVLVLTNAPVFDVDCLLVSHLGRYLALYGTRGLNVIELPRKWGPNSAFEGGKESILCRTWTLCERLFVCNQAIALLEVCWHPASELDQHIVLLTSDNSIRIFDVTDTEAPLIHARLAEVSPAANFSLAFASSLGESGVSFDFGPPIAHGVPEMADTELYRKEDCIWPIYVLRGNGDVVVFYHTMKGNYWKSKGIIGPLTMLPAAEDNYGADACKLACLDCSPPVLVVATTAGILYHCLVMDSDDGDNDDDGYRLAYGLYRPTLYVYECVELTLALTSIDDQELNSPLKFYKDPNAPSRYFVTHSAGIHAVHLPLIGQLSSDLTSVDPSIVEHLICTKPLASSANELASPLGLVISRQQGTTCLKLILNDGELITESLAPIVSSSMISNKQSLTPSKLEESAPRIELTEHISQILRRTANMPSLQSKKNINASNEELLQLALNSIEILKEQYMQRQELAARALEKRIKSLTNEKRVQLLEMERYDDEKAKLIEGIKKLSDKHDRTMERQQGLSSRLEKVLDKLHHSQSTLSDAERNMKKELSALVERIDAYKKGLHQAESKYFYQKDAIADQERRAGRPSHLPVPPKGQVAQLTQTLEDEGALIQRLLQRVNQLRENMAADEKE